VEGTMRIIDVMTFLVVFLLVLPCMAQLESIRLPSVADTVIVKIDNTKNIAIITWSMSSMDKSATLQNPLVSLYYVNKFGYPFVVAECEATALTGEYVIDMTQIPTDWMTKATYYTKIRYTYIDEKGDPGEIRGDDKRETAQPKDITVVKYDPFVKTLYSPVSLAEALRK
jgi:hypothetical protein